MTTPLNSVPSPRSLPTAFPSVNFGRIEQKLKKSCASNVFRRAQEAMTETGKARTAVPSKSRNSDSKGGKQRQVSKSLQQERALEVPPCLHHLETPGAAVHASLVGTHCRSVRAMPCPHGRERCRCKQCGASGWCMMR